MKNNFKRLIGLLICLFFLFSTEKTLSVDTFYLPYDEKLFDFTDVSKNSYSFEAIKYMRTNGIIEGYSDGTFRPNNTVNRAEFLKILIETRYSETEINLCLSDYTQSDWTYIFFHDVKPDDWFAKYVCMAKTHNIVEGYADGAFQPASEITFTEAAKIIVIALGLDFQESEDLWYVPYVQALADRKAIPHTILNLNKKITRSDVAETIWRIRQNITDAHYMSFEGGDCFCTPLGESYGVYWGSQCSPQCCSGLTGVWIFYSEKVNQCLPATGGVECILCGDGVCDKNSSEDYCNCPEDCLEE